MMRSAMDEKTFLEFYKNTVLRYSNNIQNYVCKLLEKERRITFDEQRSFFDADDVLYFESKKDYKGIISRTTGDINFANFYEKWEFVKLYKYSVPLFFEIKENKSLEDILNEKKIQCFDEQSFIPNMVLNTSLKDTQPIYWKKDKNIFIKFVLQKTYIIPESFDQIDYRFPVVVYVDLSNNLLDIRYDSTKYNRQFDNEAYEKIVTDCINWLKKEMNIDIFLCEHKDIIPIVNDKKYEDVKMYKQMMEMSSGGAAELTASENTDYVLPFIGEIRSLIEENEELFNQAEEVKELLLQYLIDKEATASYPYIYIKWVKAVESQSYIVRVTFDYLNHKYTLLQHITGGCKDLGMERMNDAIKYLCESRAFVKGEKV